MGVKDTLVFTGGVSDLGASPRRLREENPPRSTSSPPARRFSGANRRGPRAPGIDLSSIVQTATALGGTFPRRRCKLLLCPRTRPAVRAGHTRYRAGIGAGKAPGACASSKAGGQVLRKASLRNHRACAPRTPSPTPRRPSAACTRLARKKKAQDSGRDECSSGSRPRAIPALVRAKPTTHIDHRET